MQLQQLLATVMPAGQATKGADTPAGGEPGAFARDLGAAARQARGEASSQAGIPMTGGGNLATTAGRPLDIGSLAVMMQALDGKGEVPGQSAQLAEIVERLQLIDTAGRGGEGAADATHPLAALVEASATGEATAQPMIRDLAALAEQAAAGRPAHAPAEGAQPSMGPDDPATAEALVLAGMAEPATTLAREARVGTAPRQTAGAPAAAPRDATALPQETLAADARPAAPRPAPSTLETLRGAAPVPTSDEGPAGPTLRGDDLSRLLEARRELAPAALNAQPPAGAAAQATGSASSPSALTAPVNSPAWPQQLGQQLVLLGQRGGEQRAELHLNPAELGPLTVSLKVSEQAAQVQFLSAHAQVRGAVEQALPQLREALAEQGISLGDTSVGEQGQESGQAFAGGQPSGGEATEGSEESLAAPASQPLETVLDGRVDLYA